MAADRQIAIASSVKLVALWITGATALFDGISGWVGLGAAVYTLASGVNAWLMVQPQASIANPSLYRQFAHELIKPFRHL
jgi:hypothetical protein